MSKWLKPFLFGIWGLLLIPLITPILGKWLEENVFSDRHWRFIVIVKAAVGRKKAFELRSLGSKFRSLSDNIKARTTSSGWPDNVRDLKSAILSAFISANKFGLWVPNEHVYLLPDASFLCEYFKCVGKLLEDGYFDEANREALSWKPFLDNVKLS